MNQSVKPIRSKDLDFKVVDKASEMIYEKLRSDESFPDLADQFTRRIDQPGSHRYFMDYKHIFGSMVEHNMYIPFPKKIKDYLSQVETSMFMGVIPEIDRVWISIDNVLYLWNYKRPEEYDVYDGLSEVIVSVSLSTPKPGIFLEAIKYILVVATSVEVVILALAFDSNNTSDAMKVIPTSYVISSDNTTMLKVMGTQSGRIFMAGEDGNLYELDYHNHDSTWSSMLGLSDSNRYKCQKINHHQWHWRAVTLLPSLIRNFTIGEDPLVDICVDSARHVLYTISLRGYMSVFSLGVDYQSTKNCVYQYNIFDAIKKYVSERIYLESSLQVDGLKDLANISIIGLYIIPITESKKVHLIILLSTGVRIYLRLLTSSNSTSGVSSNISSTRLPTSVEIAFIRSPPPPNAINCSQPRVALESGMESGVLPSYLPMQQLNIKHGYYCQGIFFSSLSSTDNQHHSNHVDHDKNDKLVAIYEDLMSHNITPETLRVGQVPNLREAVNMITSCDGSDVIYGKIYDIKEKDMSMISHVTSKIQTLVTFSSTPVSSQVQYQDEEIPSYQHSIIMKDSMTQPLPPAMIPSSLNPHGNGPSWGVGNNTQDHAIIRNEFVSSHVPIMNRNQHRQFLCLTNHGIHILTKLTPADMLVRILSSAHHQPISSSSSSTSSVPSSIPSSVSSYLDEARSFFEKYGMIQSSIICIALACGLPAAAGNYLEQTLSLSLLSSSSTTGVVNINLANRAILAMQKLTQGSNIRSPMMITSASMNVGSIDPRLAVRGSVSYDYATSPVLDALFAITSRILRPYWLRAMVSHHNMIAEYVDTASISYMKTSLTRLSSYFEEYHPLAIRGDPVINITSTSSHHHPTPSSSRAGSSVMDQLFMMNNPNLSHEHELHQYAKNLEDATLNALYRMIARAIQALELLSYLFELDQHHHIPISWTLLAKYTLKSWVISSHVHERLKRVIREVLLHFTFLSSSSSSSSVQSSSASQYHVIIQEFIDHLSSKCYYYFSQGDRYAYDAAVTEQHIKHFLYDHVPGMKPAPVSSSTSSSTASYDSNMMNSPPNLMLRIPSYTLRQQLSHMMKQCVDQWTHAVADWKSIDYVIIPSSSTSASSISSSASSASSSASAARNRASYDYASELSRICTSLRDLGGYCRGGIVDICLTAAKNFYHNINDDDHHISSSSRLYHRSSLSKASYDDEHDDDDWDHMIYHGRPNLSDDVLLRARRECYQCLVHHFLQIIHIMKFYPAITSSSSSSMSDDMTGFEVTLPEMINRAMMLCDDDVIFHEILFETLYKESPKHLIQMASSSFLENYLFVKDPLLLNRHYEYHGQYAKAAKLMASLAQTDRPLIISTRVDYLKSAVASATQAKSSSTSSSSSSYHHNISSSSINISSPYDDMMSLIPHEGYQDLLDIAIIQHHAYDKLSSPPLAVIYPIASHPAIQKLHHQLLSISELYNDIASVYCLWDVNLMLIKAAGYDNNDVTIRLWNSIIYRLVPVKATSDIAVTFLQEKRLPEHLDIDTNFISGRASSPVILSASFEEQQRWRPELSPSILSLCHHLDLAHTSPTGSHAYFPLVHILSEIEDISSILFITGNPGPRGWFIEECVLKIPLSYDVIMEAYMMLFERWIGRGAEKLLLALSSAVYALKKWIMMVKESHGAISSSAHRQLMDSIVSGKMLLWQDKLRRLVNMLSGKASISYANNRVEEERALLENINKDLEAINQHVTNMTFL